MGLIKEMIKGDIKNAVAGTALNVSIKALDYLSNKLDENSDERNEKYKNKLFKKHPKDKHMVVETVSYNPKSQYKIYDDNLAPIFYATGKEMKKASISIFDIKKEKRGCVQGEWINKNKLFKQATIIVRAEYGMGNHSGEMSFNDKGFQNEFFKYEDWTIEISKLGSEIMLSKDNREIVHIEKHAVRGLYVISMTEELDKMAIIALVISYDVGRTLRSVEAQKQNLKHAQY